MSDIYNILVWKLAKDAYLVASNLSRSIEDRLYCTKFLFRLNKQIVALNYEGTKFDVYFTVWAIVTLIKKKYGTEKAYTELLRFYPELDSTKYYDAVDSEMFDLTD